MKYIILAIFGCSMGLAMQAQSTEDSVKTAVNRLFTAMKNADPVMLQTAFADSAILQSVNSSNEGLVSIKSESIKDFAVAIGKLAKGDADEQIQFDNIRIDGPLAAVWAPYKLFFKGKFLHCGVDAFQLLRIAGIWKIQYLIDTRHKQGCN
jgi:hypothetical protein